MNRCARILFDIQERSGLERDSGCPLYMYRITSEELARLRIELANRFEIAGCLRTPEECAAFCLFAAEWFRRHYERGVWSWDTISSGIEGLKPHALRTFNAKRGEYTIDGFRWWNLDLIRTAASKRYLTSVVCQGGLPLRTLSNDGASLSRVMRQCLRQHETYPGEPIGEIVEEFIGYLPETLQEPEVRQLIGAVTTAIAELRKQSDQAEGLGLCRRDFLDRHAPGWHEKLPFRLEDPEAQTLILSILDSRKAQVFDRQPLAILTNLIRHEGRLRLQRTLKHPAEIESDLFRKLCGLPADKALDPRMTGFLSAGETRVQSCTIAKPFEGTTLRIHTAGQASLTGADAARRTTLMVRSGKQAVADAMLPGGEALPTSPWVFSADESCDLIGVGSIRTRHESVFVAFPQDATVRGDFKLTKDVVEDRCLYLVSGSAEVYQDDTVYRIRTREKQEVEAIYELRGSRRREGTGKDVWLGQPSVVELQLNNDNAPRVLADHEVKWRPARGGQWKRLSDGCLGDVLIRADVEGECKLQTRLTVLPPDFDVATRASATEPNVGQWLFSGLQDGKLHFESNDHLQFESSRRGDETIVSVRVVGNRAPSVSCKIRFDENRAAELKLVCPTQSCELVGIGGSFIDARVGIPSEQLDGMRVRMIQPGNQQPYILELEHSQIIDGLTEVSPGVWEYPLSFIKDRANGLLAASDNPDGEIQFGVMVGRSLRPTFRWRISRYGFGLEPARNHSESEEVLSGESQKYRSCVQIRNPELRRQMTDGVHVKVIALNDPKFVLPEESTEMTGPGQWTISHVDEPPGYYLVTGRTENGEILRPLRIANKPEEVPTPPEEKPEAEYSFNEISTIRSRARRLEVWDHYFERVVKDFGHEEWANVQSVVAASMTLPITTFETVAAITRNPIAAARFGILEPGNARLWQRLEELPFLWSLIPVESWITCAFRTRNYFQSTMESVGIPAEQITKTIDEKSAAFAKHAPDRYPSMCCVTACLFHAGLVSPSLLKLTGTSLQDYQRALAGLFSRNESFDSRITWPNPRLKITDQVRQLLNSTPNLINRDTHRNQWDVINAPAIAAIHSAYGVTPDLTLMRDLKRLRSFDTEWFDAANLYALYHVLDRRTKEDADWINRIVQAEKLAATLTHNSTIKTAQ